MLSSSVGQKCRRHDVADSVDRASERESSRETVAGIFTRDPLDERVAVAHGYGMQLRILYGHLVLRDGIGKHRRERKYGKADRTLQRIVVTGPDGYLTVEALRWCAEHGITVALLNPDGELTAHYAADGKPAEPKLLRHQANADGLEIARELLTRKVNGQAGVLLKQFSDYETASKLYHYAQRMAESTVITQHDRDTASLSELEGWSGREYFAAWRNRVPIRFDEKSRDRIPGSWISYPGRSSVVSGKKYNATDPVNAILNYAYTLGYAEARTACIAHGLHPTLGFIHADKNGRDSLALDILETFRPDIDNYVLDLVSRRAFTYREFAEPYGYEPGTVRLVAPLTHEIAETSYSWCKLADDAAQLVVSYLTGHQGKRGESMPNWKVHKTAFVNERISADDILTEDSYARLFASIVPPFTRQRRGHPPISDRIIVAAIVHCERNHRPWAHVPESLGVSHRTLTERRRMWQRQGVWPEIKVMIDELALERR